MRRNLLRLWRSHPVLFAALIGAIVGVANVLVLEIGGALQKNSGAAVLLFLPNPAQGIAINRTSILLSAFILLIEIIANVLVYALMFAAPVGLFVLLRRAFKGRRAR